MASYGMNKFVAGSMDAVKEKVAAALLCVAKWKLVIL